MGAVPEAARATYLVDPALLVRDFVRRPGLTS
jgi:hypothetical protein